MARLHGIDWRTMRTITLLRHAKSSWPTPSPGGKPLADEARPLAPRGLRDAPLMAAWMAGNGIRPDCVLCSTAVRTRQTLDQMKDVALAKGARIVYRADLYLAEAMDLIQIVRRLGDDVHHVMLVGHDPGLHDLAQMLSGSGERELRHLLAEKFPTGAAAVIEFDTDEWSDIAAGAGRLRHFMAPKRLPA